MDKIQPSFRLPAEYEEHKRTWMIWPYRLDTWHSNALPARENYAKVANAISEFEPVTMIIREEDKQLAKKLLNEKIQLISFPFNSEWARDFGPIFVKDRNQQISGINFEFNSWNEIYPDWELDNELATLITKQCQYNVIINDLILEGGAINVDGEGTLMATEECFFNPKLKIKHTKAELESVFQQYFGVTKIIWLKKGLYKDIVNGHIDNICVFINPAKVLLAWTEDKTDPQYEISKSAYEILSQTKDAKNRKIEINKIHLPTPLFVKEYENKLIGESFYQVGDRLPSSYINLYFVNGGVILPGFDDPKYDKLAYNRLSELFPDRKIVQINSREILLGGGGIHCITMQEPK